MRITPQTESAVMDAGLLPAGQYSFTVQSAEEKTSKAGHPMIVAKLEVYDGDGKARTITDYLMESVAYKLRHFAYAVGLGTRYEAGELGAAEMVGLSGRCVLRIEPAKDGFNAKNSVKDYCKPDADTASAPAPSRPSAPATAPSTDEPPF